MSTAAMPVPSAPSAPSTDLLDLPAHVRIGRALRTLVKILKDPTQTELVLEFSNLINASGNRDDRLDFFLADPRGADLYARRRALDSRTIDLDALAALPAGTLGHAYATFMRRHGLTPDVFDGAPADVRDPRASYVIQRMRQTHDLWHVATNAETDPAGEIALQAFTFAQVHAPSSAILAITGTLRSLRKHPRVLRDVRRLFELGRAAQPLPLFAWEDHWATPLAEVRRLLGLPAEMPVTGGYSYDEIRAAA